MVRYRVLAPINTVKHFVARTNTLSATGTVVNLTVADAVAAPASASTLQVLEGAVLKAVHLELWFLQDGNSGTNTQITLIVEKIPAGATPPTLTNLANLQAYLNKKNILFTFQGNLGASIDGVQQIPILRDWVLIPKGKQRMGLGDKIVISFISIGQSIATCGMFIYKEYR